MVSLCGQGPKGRKIQTTRRLATKKPQDLRIQVGSMSRCTIQAKKRLVTPHPSCTSTAVAAWSKCHSLPAERRKKEQEGPRLLSVDSPRSKRFCFMPRQATSDPFTHFLLAEFQHRTPHLNTTIRVARQHWHTGQQVPPTSDCISFIITQGSSNGRG
jgi:hypothetical protein